MAVASAYGCSTIVCDTWTVLTDYQVGNFVVPTIPNDRLYECTVAGTSGM